MAVTAILATVANLGTASVINGTLDITGNDIVGTAGVFGPITSTLTVGNNGVATFGGSVAAGQTVTFGDVTGTLNLGDPADFAGTITGFGASASGTDKIDLAGINHSSAQFSETYLAGVLSVTDGTNSANINLTGFNGVLKFAADSAGTGTLVSADQPPVISGTSDLAITVNQGGAVTLTTADLSATDGDNSADQITFNVTSPLHGHVALSGTPTTAITSFTQAQLAAGSVLFVSDGTSNATASFTVTATDGSLTTAPVTVNATVSAAFVLPGDITVYASSETISTLTQSGGTLTDAGTLTVSGATTITGGTETGGGTTTADGSTSFFNAANQTFTLDGSTLKLATSGTVTINAFSGDVINLNNSADLVVASTASVQGGDETITGPLGVGGFAGEVINKGLLWEVASGESETINVAFVNDSTIQIDLGASRSMSRTCSRARAISP